MRATGTHIGLAVAESLIESHIEDTDATVSRPRAVSQGREDDCYAAAVVSPASEGKSLV